MNYKLIYQNLINKRLQECPEGYIERHHILPSSMGGSSSEENLVALTGREHWIAHLLLYKIHKNKQTACACHMMAMMCEERGIPHVRNSRMYAAIRIKCAKYISEANSKHQIGENNSQYGLIWICNIELEENKKIKKDEDIPEGWIRGRNKWKHIKYCIKCGSKFISRTNKYCSQKCRPTTRGLRFSHSDETKEKMSENHYDCSGKNNSQYGTMYIYNLELKESKRISKDDPIPNGWLKGRKIIF